ncbi:MAG: alpha/beta fold hydrolase [Persicimonas sp.]
MPTFRTYTTGPDDAPAVVFLHGFMGSAADFAPVVSKLVDRMGERLRCVRVDLPGHGSAPLAASTLSMPALATQLRGEVLAPLGRPALVGYSMGGRLALQTALDHPGAVGELVLVSTSPGITDEAARAERRRADRERAARIRADYDAFLDAWYRLPIFGELLEAPGHVAMLDRRRQNDPESMARTIVEFSPGRQPSNWGRLDALEAATWLVGADDPKYAALGDDLAAAGHRVIAAADAAHALHVERPDWLVDQIRSIYSSSPCRQVNSSSAGISSF